MITISGYTITDTIHKGLRSIVYRGRRERDNQPVVIKTHKTDYPSPLEITRYRHEYEIGSKFDCPRIIKYYPPEKYRNHEVLVVEDFGAVALTEIIVPGGIELTTFLQIALQLAEALAETHKKDIIHKDIKPSNVLVNPTTEVIKIIDFGISSQLSRENQQVFNPNTLEGTLAYISPEQTGRMNRAIDYRTDFYSLGVTFYELLTGKLPFQATEPLELVHAHIAKMPTPPHELRPDIPRAVADIVSKLLAKTAEDRYHSAYGLKADLQACLDQWQATGIIEDVTPGENDVFDRFEIPQKLYGREQEINTLVAAFDRVCEAGPSEMMLVTGFSGIGKSALIHEIHKPLVRERGYFISGKFDQFQRNIPYRAIIQAFQELVRQLLTEGEDQIRRWKEELLRALGPNGQVIVDVIPEIELIIDKQPPVTELGPEEAQNRFILVFQNFLSVFTTREHPLALFLDDLQWADSASLKLMRLFTTNPDSQYLFFIGAYRDNETTPSDPLILTLDEIKKTDVVVSHIALAPLATSHITDLIADTLNYTPDQSRPLAELVLNKTGGNPFFLNQFLMTLHEEQSIRFDFSQNVWLWDAEHIQTLGFTDNVVELMANKLQKLPRQTQRVLQLAACIGNQFELGTLARVNESTPRETYKNLLVAIQEGLILQIGRWINGQNADESVDQDLDIGLPSAKFLHDRVQQAAYSLIPEGHEQKIHHRVGRLLLKNTSKNEREEKIFDIVNQLNFGIDLITYQDERDELAQLNLLAGRKAKASAAYEAALKYLLTGMNLLTKSGDSWQTNYELTLALHVEAAETAYLGADFEQMEALVETVLRQAKSLLDQAKVYETRIQAYMAQNKMLEAVETARQVLSLLGITLPEKPTRLNIILGLIRTKLTLGRKKIEDLENLPEMTDPHKLAAMRILMSTSSAAYIAAPDMFPLVVFNMVNLSVKYGNASLSAFGYVTYGLILGGALGDINSGYEFGKFGLSLRERFKAEELKAKLSTAFDALMRHWKHPVKDTLAPLLEGYKSGLDTGDVEYAALCAVMYCYNAFACGQELDRLESEVAKYTNVMQKFRQDRSLRGHSLRSQVILNLIGRSKNPQRLIGESYDEEEMLPLLIEANDRSEICVFYTYKSVLNYLFGDYDQSLENARLAEKYLEAIPGQLLGPVQNLFHSLALLALFSAAQPQEQKQYLRKVAANQKKMKKWVDHGPMNHLHKYYLVEAEQARVLGLDMKAMHHYSRAIKSARENEFIHEEALAQELAAKFYLDKEMQTVAKAHFIDARYSYLRWGAKAKVEDLDQEYPDLLAGATIEGAAISPDYTETAHSQSTPRTTLETLDLQTVIKASQDISGEIVLETLLKKLIKRVIENAGAQRGCLLLEKNGDWVIEAEGTLEKVKAVDEDETEVMALQSIALENYDKLSRAIINYVVRTKENVVLNDAFRESLFTQDPYISQNKPKSILCTPLINQGKLTGILYLENNLTAGAFTPDRLELLKLLSGQIAISIENARLYANLEESEKKYRTIFEDSTDTIFVTSPEGEIITINPAGLDLFGYTAAEVKRMNAEDVYANPADRRRVREEIERQGSVRDYEIKFRRKTGEEIDGLVTATLRHTDDGRVMGYQGIIRDITEQKRAEKIQRELEVAHDIQASLLPARRPNWAGLDAVCFSTPAREVGGDFYAYHAFDQGGFAIAVGDVSGKGMPAALLMAVSLSSFQTIIPQALRPGELLTSLDKVIARYTRGSRQNCALCYVEISPPRQRPEEAEAERVLRAANAGCIPPLIRRTDGTVKWAEAIGLPLGVGLDFELGYDEVSFGLDKGDLVILTSDGVVEATNAVGNLFGFERLERAVAGGPQSSAEAMLAHLQSEVKAFVGQSEPHDDLTIVVLQI